MSSRTVKVPNISCGHCVKTIERELGDLEGVSEVSADQPSKEVRVEWDDDTLAWEDVSGFLAKIGYPVG